MARRKSDSPQKAAMREMMQGYLKNNDISIKSGNDVNSIMRDMMSVLLEGPLDEELNEELGYSKYDYRNKETDNSRNGHSKKTMHTSYGDMDIAISRDRKGEYEPQLINKTDLAPLVGADLDVMASDSQRMRQGRKFLFSNFMSMEGVDEIIDWIKKDVLFEGME